MAELFIRTSIGDVVLDAELVEAHTSDLRITENPVESGAAVADHAVLQPKEVTIEGLIVDYEPVEVELPDMPRLSLRPADFLNLLPQAMDFSTMTAQARVYAERMLMSYAAHKLPGLQKVGRTIAPLLQSQGLRTIAPWLPGHEALRDESGSGDRLQRVYDSLLAIQKSGQTVSIQTGLKLYENMLLPSISATEEQRGSIRVSITAREIFIVENKSVAGVSVPMAGASKSGRAGAQSAAKSQKGNTNPKDVDADKNRSFGRRAVDFGKEVWSGSRK